jgi:hypothetical protein
LDLTLNDSLADLSGLAVASVDQDANISADPVLGNIEGLANLTSVGGQLQLYNDPLLGDVEGLRGLTRAGSILLDTCPVTTLAGLRSLTSVATLRIETTGLTSLAGLGPIVFDAGGEFDVEDSPQLATLADFSGTATSLSEASFSGLKIPDLQGLQWLTNVDNLTINFDPALTSLAGLDNLTEVGNLDIESDPQLASLDGLSSLTQLSTLAVRTNPLLPACEIRALAQRTNSQSVGQSGNNNRATCQ